MQKETREYVINIDKVHKNILNPEHFHSLFSKKNLTIGQKAADILTKFAGSWTFIIIFGLILILWVITNGYFLIKWYQGAFDPYPFILLNLFLSCLAAIQAPIILMSQNREGERDRIRMHYDYAVNRKAEKEIRDIQRDIADIKKKMGVK